MWIRTTLIVCFTAAASVGLSACTIEDISTCEEGAYCAYGQDDGDFPCPAMCGRLVDCGRISEADRASCVDACIDDLEDDYDDTLEYCGCVSETSCVDLIDDECGRPPISVPPPDDENGGGGSSSGGGGSSSGGSGGDGGAGSGGDGGSANSGGSTDGGSGGDGGGANSGGSTDGGSGGDGSAPPAPDAGSDPMPGNCSTDEDCAISEGCLEGLCRAMCQASCECRLGDTCEDGLCVPPPPTPMSCENDCDCPAGESCVDNGCVAPE